SRLVQGTKTDNFEAAVKLSWDENNLYLLANVKDSTPMINPEASNRLWNGDGLELFIGSEKIGDGGPLLFTDRQVLIGAGKSGQIYFANAPQQHSAETIVV